MTDDDDHDFFMSEMKHVAPLSPKHHDVHVVKPKKISRKPRPQFLEESNKPDIPLSAWDLEAAFNDGSTSEYTFYTKIHLGKRDKRQLVQASQQVKHTLDLHGLSMEQAWEMTLAYIDDLYHNGQQYGLIVHGKGHYSEDGIARLKKMLITHLPKHPHILAFHSALPHNGGTGALAIRLKSLKKGN
jgi:DNA-nicking Smr family endonuclease